VPLGSCRFSPRVFMADSWDINVTKQKRNGLNKVPIALRAELKAKKDTHGLAQMPRERESSARGVNRAKSCPPARVSFARFTM